MIVARLIVGVHAAACLPRTVQRYFTLPPGHTEVPIDTDGNCQFSAVAFGIFGDTKKYKEVRHAVSWYLQERSDLEPFLDKDEFPDWESFISFIRQEGSWGDHLTLFGAANIYNVNIKVFYSDDTPPQLISQDESSTSRPQIEILYYPQQKHYNAVQKE